MIQLKDHILNGCRMSKVQVKQHTCWIFHIKQGNLNNLFWRILMVQRVHGSLELDCVNSKNPGFPLPSDVTQWGKSFNISVPQLLFLLGVGFYHPYYFIPEEPWDLNRGFISPLPKDSWPTDFDSLGLRYILSWPCFQQWSRKKRIWSFS